MKGRVDVGYEEFDEFVKELEEAGFGAARALKDEYEHFSEKGYGEDTAANKALANFEKKSQEEFLEKAKDNKIYVRDKDKYDGEVDKCPHDKNITSDYIGLALCMHQHGYTFPEEIYNGTEKEDKEKVYSTDEEEGKYEDIFEELKEMLEEDNGDSGSLLDNIKNGNDSKSGDSESNSYETNIEKYDEAKDKKVPDGSPQYVAGSVFGGGVLDALGDWTTGTREFLKEIYEGSTYNPTSDDNYPDLSMPKEYAIGSEIGVGEIEGIEDPKRELYKELGDLKEEIKRLTSEE